MSKKNLLSGRDKELQELAEQYEAAKAENKPIYLDADDLADLADWYAMHGKSEQATEVVEYGLSLPRQHPSTGGTGLSLHGCPEQRASQTGNRANIRGLLFGSEGT